MQMLPLVLIIKIKQQFNIKTPLFLGVLSTCVVLKSIDEQIL